MLEDILRLSEDMLSAARSENFDRLSQLERQRNELLGKITALKIPPLRLAEALRQVGTLDRAILAILEQERETAEKALRELRRSRRAARIYAEAE